MNESREATMKQVTSIRDMTFKPNSLGYRALTNAIYYMQNKNAEEIMEDKDDNTCWKETWTK